ncbi:hypothetical protein GZH47_33365 (plasmid) [Paenibacillus rhizovicinus]|uniref:Uncharacterized protein n=1 Tax=Paenibacillus rhizovicinus TaxID=2704463 RepID=A0A6C0PBP3_9BACL|nr:hypothetical protein [Paenibacillus rhizovicinus]QHW35785.1 hypothetical protein GZH47_33365 [Paenibacillus rhizovicinus]
MRQIKINTWYPDKNGNMIDLMTLTTKPTGSDVTLDDGEYVINGVGYLVENGVLTAALEPPGAGQMEFDLIVTETRNELAIPSDSFKKPEASKLIA